MGGRRPLREQTVVTLDCDFTNLVDVTNLRARHKSRTGHKSSNTSQILEAERHLKNNGRPEAAP